MKTAEEHLKEKCHPFNPGPVFGLEEVLDLMESYGKQHAIEFAKWNKKYTIPARIAIGLRYREWTNNT